jgi:hypothetical protein
LGADLERSLDVRFGGIRAADQDKLPNSKEVRNIGNNLGKKQI